MQAQPQSGHPPGSSSTQPNGNRCRAQALVRLLVDDCGFHPGDLVDPEADEPLAVDALECLAWSCHLEQAHGFDWSDLDSEPTETSPTELEAIHRTVAPECFWSVRDVTSRHEAGGDS